MSGLYRLVAIVTLLAANSCAGPPDDIRQNPAWMIGKWGWVSLSEQTRLAGDCSPEVEFYRRDGYVVDGQSTERWWIEGDTFVRQQIGKAYGENVDGKIYRNRFTRIGPGELLFKDGESTQKLVRCGDVPPEWNSAPVN